LRERRKSEVARRHRRRAAEDLGESGIGFGTELDDLRPHRSQQIQTRGVLEIGTHDHREQLVA
jgi:hypothetical protein